MLIILVKNFFIFRKKNLEIVYTVMKLQIKSTDCSSVVSIEDRLRVISSKCCVSIVLIRNIEHLNAEVNKAVKIVAYNTIFQFVIIESKHRQIYLYRMKT